MGPPTFFFELQTTLFGESEDKAVARIYHVKEQFMQTSKVQPDIRATALMFDREVLACVRAYFYRTRIAFCCEFGM